jgi:translation initiation factor 3 subunit J
VPVAAARGNFDDEEEDGILDSWEAAGESEDEEAKLSGPTRKRVPVQVRVSERERKEQEERERAALAAAEETEEAKRERLRKAEQDSDLNHAATLFGEIDIHPRAKAASPRPEPVAAGPAKLSDLAIFKPNTKQEYDSLRKTLVPIITDLHESAGSIQFAAFITDFVRDVCKPLTSDQARKVTSTLNALTNDKQREERANRGKKPKPTVKQATLKNDSSKDITNYDQFDDEDDFM